jgi:nitrate/nitrite transport system ATP-binding protein
LSDRILLMSNGPNAVIAEDVQVDLPRPRARGEIINEPGYYKLRNYLLDFLVNRAKTANVVTEGQPFPKTVNPLTTVRGGYTPHAATA